MRLFVLLALMVCYCYGNPVDPAFGRGVPEPSFYRLPPPTSSSDGKAEMRMEMHEEEEEEPTNPGFMKGMDFGHMFKRYREAGLPAESRRQPPEQDFSESHEDSKEGHEGQGFVIGRPFGVPSQFREGFDSIPDFSGPFGGDGGGFASFLNSVNEGAFGDSGPNDNFNSRRRAAQDNAYKREVSAVRRPERQYHPKIDVGFVRPKPVYRPQPEEEEYNRYYHQDSKDIVDPLDEFQAPNFPESAFDFKRFDESSSRHRQNEGQEPTYLPPPPPPQSHQKRQKTQVFDPKLQQRQIEKEFDQSAIIRPIPTKKPISPVYEKKNYRSPVRPVPHSQYNDHKIIRIKKPSRQQQEERFRPLGQDSTSSSGPEGGYFDNDQEIITVAPLSKRRFTSPKRGQTFDVKLGAAFNTRDGKPLDQRSLEPIRQHRAFFYEGEEPMPMKPSVFEENFFF